MAYTIVGSNTLATDLSGLSLPREDTDTLRKVMLFVANMSRFVPDMSWEVNRQVTVESFSATCKPFCDTSMHFVSAMFDSIPALKKMILTPYSENKDGPNTRKRFTSATFVCARKEQREDERDRKKLKRDD